MSTDVLADIQIVIRNLHEARGAAHAFHVGDVAEMPAEEYSKSARACLRVACDPITKAIAAAERIQAELESRPVSKCEHGCNDVGPQAGCPKHGVIAFLRAQQEVV